jgi:hypothetical protein
VRITGTQIIQLVKAVAWPLLALVAIMLFYSPIYTTLDAISRRSEEVQTIKLGQLELSIRASDLPRPSPEVAKIITSLDEQMIVQLLAIDGPVYRCFNNQLETNSLYLIHKSLADKKQITLTKSKELQGCENHHSVDLTDGGKKTREFLVSLLTKQIQTGRSRNP